MNYIKLFQTQAELDSKIVERKGLEGQDLFMNKVEALLCEIQECANEQRSWKFWSKNREPRKSIKCIACHGVGEVYEPIVGFQQTCPHCDGSGLENDKNPLLEETVDTFHFILSLGNDLKVSPSVVEEQPVSRYDDITEQFIALSYTASCIAMYNDKQLYYLETIKLFKGLVHLLGFTEEQLEEAYYDKNKINHERQVTNY